MFFLRFAKSTAAQRFTCLQVAPTRATIVAANPPRVILTIRVLYTRESPDKLPSQYRSVIKPLNRYAAQELVLMAHRHQSRKLQPTFVLEILIL
jgi:hypothetical protein